MKADATGCTDLICTHEEHCPTAHFRLAHSLVSILTGQKMDAPSLVRGVCSCGNYRTGVGTEPHARLDHNQHQAAKLDALVKKFLPCVDCPSEVHEAFARRRAAAGQP